EKGEAAQIRHIEEHEIEQVIAQASLRSQRILQQLEAGSSVGIERHQLAIEHGVVCDRLKRSGNCAIAVADDLAVAREELDLSPFDAGHHAKAVPLGLEYPSRVVE